MNTNTRTESMALATAKVPEAVPMNSASASALMLSDTSMDKLMRVADMMASGRCTVPQHLQKSPGDCFAVAMQATMWNMNPFAVAQKTHVSQSGALGYEAQLVSAVVTSSGAVDGDPEYEFFGDWSKVLGKVEERKSDKGGKYYVATYTKADEAGLGVVCRLRLRGEKEPREMEVLMSQCYPRFSTQWATDPKQQICYVAIRKWARLHKPGVILGVYTPDELEQIPRDMGPAEEVSLWTKEQETAGDEAAAKGTAAYGAFWKGLGRDLQAKLAGTKEHQQFKDQAQRADATRTIDVPTPTPAPAPAADKATGEVVTTVEDVRSKLEAAKTEDALYVAMDWASAIPQPEQDAARADLETLFNQRLAAIRGE